ncbi:MAG: hypothetical protein LRY51_04405 [Geovibrio sp.]|nr:hypothetical protein [Geovibrio sp.]
MLHSFPADSREASILADGYSASTKRPYAIMIFGMDGRMLYSGKSAGASDDWALTPAAKDFDTARENPGGVTRIRYSYSKKSFGDNEL